MKNDVEQRAAGFDDGDIVDVYFEDDSVERIDFGGIEAFEGKATIVTYFVREDCTCDWIDLDDVVDLKLVQPWTGRAPEELVTNTIGTGSRPASQSAFALRGKRFRARQPFDAHLAGEPDRTVEVRAGCIVIVVLANPDATALVFEIPDDETRFVLERSRMPDLLEPI